MRLSTKIQSFFDSLLSEGRKKAFTAVLTIAALAMGQHVWAANTWSLTSSTSGSTTTFTITRNESTAAETVCYRTVSLSAIEGQHFTAATGSLAFAVGETSKTVSVTEKTPTTDAYKFQSTTSRVYRFEVLDLDGSVIAQRDRTVSVGTQFTGTYLNKSIASLVYFFKDKNYSFASLASNYLDVAHSGSADTWIKVTDAGYTQAVHTVATSSLFGGNSDLRTHLSSIGVKMYATVYFTQKEENDGYQYIQILADNASTYDGNDDNGAVSTPSTSLYKACFILSYSPSGSVMTEPHTQFFPHRWDYPDRGAQYTANASSRAEFDYDNAHLYEQEFQDGSLRAENSGSLVLEPTVNNLNIRFDAAGSGEDDWYFKDLKVRLALEDATAPAVLDNCKVSGGRHQKGNYIYVSVPFSEIVTVEDTPTLTTTWGKFSYTAGSGSNVLTFGGFISYDAAGTFSVSALSGTVKDLAGNAFSGTVSKDFGTTLDEAYAWTLSGLNLLEANTYEIASKSDLYRLASIVNVSHIECDGITFRQTQDIVCDAGYTPIGFHNNNDEAKFSGTYDGQGHTISGITVTRTGNTLYDSRLGIFGRIYNATVRNIILANSTFTGNEFGGGIVGYNYNSTVQNCRVESTVAIKAGYSSAFYAGGVVGYSGGSRATVVGCVSAATVSRNGMNSYMRCGGIVGYLDISTVKDCLYTGTVVEGTSYKGAIVGQKDGGTLTNNYYTAISLGGVGDESSSTDLDGARRARTVTLGEGVALSDAPTTYDVSGITAYGSTAIGYDGKIYSGEGQTLTLSYTGNIPSGYAFDGFSVNGAAIDGNTFTMPAENVTVTATLTPIDWATQSAGTAEDPYMIYNKDQLDLLAHRVNGTHGETADENGYSGKYFCLGADITYNYDGLGATESNYEAIGGYFNDSDQYFSGIFDGQGHTISGIRIYKETDMYQGLFGQISIPAEVKNVILADATITGYGSIGTIVGIINSGSVANCHVLANVSVNAVQSNSYYYGGIAGVNSGTVTGCTSAAVFTDATNSLSGVGGIVGHNVATVSDCIYLGTTLGGSSEVGAIVGENHKNDILRTSYFTDANIKGKDASGADIDYALSAVGYNNDGTVDNATVGPALRDGADNSTFLTLMAARNQTLTAVSRTPALGITADATLTGRTLYRDGSWNTLCLPFNVDLTDSEGPLYGAVAKQLTAASISGSTLNLTFGEAVSTLQAGTPYIIKWARADGYVDDDAHNIVSPVFEGVTIDATQRDATFDDVLTFTGTYAPVSIDSEGDNTKLFLGASNTLYWPNAAMTIGSQRAYFQLAEGLSAGESSSGGSVKQISAFALDFGDDDATGIMTTNFTNSRNEWYTLDGRKLDGKPTLRGIYINKGNKVVIK